MHYLIPKYIISLTFYFAHLIIALILTLIMTSISVTPFNQSKSKQRKHDTYVNDFLSILSLSDKKSSVYWQLGHNNQENCNEGAGIRKPPCPAPEDTWLLW